MYRVMFNLYFNCIKGGGLGVLPQKIFTELGTKLGNSKHL